MEYKDIILINEDDFKRAIALLEDAGIEVSVPVSRKGYYIP